VSSSANEGSRKRNPRCVRVSKSAGKSMWIYCNHCNKKLFVIPTVRDDRYYRHKCFEGKYVTWALKDVKGNRCQVEHSGGCMRKLDASEYPTAMEIAESYKSRSVSRSPKGSDSD